MANYDIKHDTAPSNPAGRPRGPKISDLRTALLAVNGGASYPATRLNVMSRNDMIHAAVKHNLTVAGL